MKKVRYLAGAVGAVGAAPGLLCGPVAVAAPGGPAAPGAKTVSLRHQTASATSASSISATGTGCIGHTSTGLIQNKHYSSATHFFWTNDPNGGTKSVCIGTVVGYVQLPMFSDSYYRIRIYEHSPHGSKFMATHYSVPGICSPEGGCGGGKHKFSHAFRMVFEDKPIQVCGVGVSFNHGTGKHSPVGPPQCKSVG